MFAESEAKKQRRKLLNRNNNRRYRERHSELVRERQAKWRRDNPERVRAYEDAREYKATEKIRATRRAWALANIEKVRAKSKAWKAANPELVRASRKRYKAKVMASPHGNLCNRMRCAVRRSLAQGKSGSTFDLLGYTCDELRAHLERQFLPGMTWGNMGKWHIDHIVPLSSFSFSSSVDHGFHLAWALSNLRPLWAKENVSKNAKRLFLL